MPDLPATLRVVYDARGHAPDEVALGDVYLDLDFPDVVERPFVYGNMVQTFDGQAVLQGRAYTIGSAVDHFLLRQLRVHADAVLYGAGTLRLDDVIVTTHPHLQERRRREGRPPNPPTVVVSATARFGDEVLRSKQFFRRTDFDRIVATTSRASEAALRRLRELGVAVEILPAGAHGEVDLTALLRWLQARGVHRVLCEGGPTLNAALDRAGLIDELFVTVALRLGGETGRPRIFGAPVPSRRLIPVQILLFVDGAGPREMYFRLRLSPP
ncbi:MAG: dihydrofolate reductase family protein [Armatimonadota bacterium]|nr:dihydrofolate reductase family protein [Armatimonadota bacterium]MDR7452326.1 dihydrofolate reductase family protein [Armatimonadota bacterium]MDR7467783.1 dihydrofolate reductase family protein [Armatimonadota bacterium]MDR7494631.1 dihydrofolate reductase family protein [Armatimonadota bacterium]MDR7499691.1 dihydrofolate reductase family protein [Armatimonadota bacterium]